MHCLLVRSWSSLGWAHRRVGQQTEEARTCSGSHNLSTLRAEIRNHANNRHARCAHAAAHAYTSSYVPEFRSPKPQLTIESNFVAHLQKTPELRLFSCAKPAHFAKWWMSGMFRTLALHCNPSRSSIRDGLVNTNRIPKSRRLFSWKKQLKTQRHPRGVSPNVNFKIRL